jgi:enoyl-CoA hydratase
VRRAGRERFLRLLLTADRIDASTALEWRLVDEVVAPDQLVDRVRAVAAARARA